MKTGDAVKIDFAGKKKDAVVLKVFPNSVHLRVDFENHKGKVVKRKLTALGEKKAAAPEKKAPKQEKKSADKKSDKKKK